ncbi:MAG: glycosyltransferase family 2 protein [Salibacteraceae bacterium]
MESHRQKIDFSIVVSVYNEAAGLPSFWLELSAEIKSKPYAFEVIFVNDGSTDPSAETLKSIQVSAENGAVRVIEFSRNYGHEAAMIAGIDEAVGNAIVCMDADLQHPPSVIGEMIKASEQGADIVLTERMKRADNGFIKNMLSGVFYSMINALSNFRLHPNSTDFFMISRPVAEVLKQHFRDRNRFIRGFIQSIGFERVTIPFEAPAREHGSSNYSTSDLLRLATTAIFAYSNKPLRISIFISLLFIALTIVLAVYTLYQFLVGSTPPSGYTTIIIFLSASFSALFGVIAVLSLYFEKSLEEQRGRPIYVIKNQS